MVFLGWVLLFLSGIRQVLTLLVGRVGVIRIGLVRVLRVGLSMVRVVVLERLPWSRQRVARMVGSGLTIIVVSARSSRRVNSVSFSVRFVVVVKGRARLYFVTLCSCTEFYFSS